MVRLQAAHLLFCCVIPSLSFGFVVGKPATASSSSSSSLSLFSSSPSMMMDAMELSPPPIVYTIAGSDSGGGAGIQADLHAIHAFLCHGCSAITCLTAQNSVGVTGVHAPPASFLQTQLDTLLEDVPPTAVKIGMLGTKELAIQVGSFLKKLKTQSSPRKVWVVLDPVMISTSGHRLIQEDAQEAMIQHIFPHVDVVTPNKHEAEALLNRKLVTTEDVEKGARDILALGAPSVLIKGGHTLSDQSDGKEEANAQDYFLSSEKIPDEPRLCDGNRGVWLRSRRYDTENTHGTGCTLSSSTAAALALGEAERSRPDRDNKRGSRSSIFTVGACCLSKAYVTAGISRGVQLGRGPGPVVQTTFPASYEHFPSIAIDPTKDSPAFRPMSPFGGCTRADDDDDHSKLGRILPIVGSEEWVECLCNIDGVTDIQLRIKDETDNKKILDLVKKCQSLCHSAHVRLWINDYWEAAIEAGCFGVHVGQEDLLKCVEAGGLEALRKKNMALGISTHSYGELAVALGVKPSYISLGPVFETGSKNVNFNPQHLGTVSNWRCLIPPDTPLVAIGGIGDATTIRRVRGAGADCCAVIGAIVNAEDPSRAVLELNEAMTMR